MNMNHSITPQHLGYFYSTPGINNITNTTNQQNSPLSYYMNQYQSHFVPPNGSYVIYQGHGNGY